MWFRTSSLIGLMVLSGGAAVGRADEAAMGPYLTDDVVAVGQVNLERIELPAIVDEAARLHILPEAQVEEARKAAAGFQQLYAELPKRGARRLYVLFRTSDLAAGGTTWLVETDNAQSARSVREWLQSQLSGISPVSDVHVILPKALDTEGAIVLAGPTAERVDEIRRRMTDAPRGEALTAIESLMDSDAGVVIFGDADGRRVVRELFPQMPVPFAEIDGKLLADGIESASVRVTLPPDPTVTLAIAAKGEETSEQLEQAFGKAREIARAALAVEMVSGPPAHKARAAALLPMLPQLQLKQEGARLSLTFGDDEQEIAFLRNLLPAMTQDLRDEASRARRINNFKQIILGMLNYEDARKALPTSASYDANGRPLLSWRVQILPYIEQGGLYHQFKLDEPWDSEHNRKLIERMPSIYADPSPEVRAASGDAGRTTIVVPTGEGLLFGGKEGPKYRDIKDGTSNTILVVEVPPSKAVVWTKPDDWEVNLQDPAKDLAREDREWFTAGYADGHVSIHSTKNEPGVLRSLLTPNGGEVLDHASIK